MKQVRVPRHPGSMLERFVHSETSGSIVLFGGTVAALVWANSPWSSSYFALWKFPLKLGGYPLFSMDLHHWINDALMVLFFLVVGLEIKREIVKGELSSIRQAALPILAALGGMIFPALIYFALNRSGPGARGWGIPMATDIGFALGVLALLGERIPSSLRVFMLAVAIVDDVGAIVVIAFFYTPQISLFPLALAGALLALLIVVAISKGPLSVYVVVGVLFWAAVLSSGVHATIAGVILGLVAPINPKCRPEELADKAESLLSNFRNQILSNDKSSAEATVAELDLLLRRVDSIAERLERSIHPWVCFLVLPLFALASAGVPLSPGQMRLAISSPIALGVFLGLIFGKATGIALFSFLAVRSKIGGMTDGLTWSGITGVSILSGIGFTVALFISGLSFEDEVLIAASKVAAIMASLAAGSIGYAYLRLTMKNKAAATAG
ncbi:MAG TPA: Na+/H+ antiporter NhaA [Candidatus Eisenbacteria bacterium]|nr:Na+/H+ antiporter NhaA [Candidatus Eisenbacteria bacterium]